MHDAFGNTLMVEMEDFLAEVKILDQRRPALTNPQGVLIVSDRPALRRRKRLCTARCNLMQLAATSSQHLLIVDRGLCQIGLLPACLGHRVSLHDYGRSTTLMQPS